MIEIIEGKWAAGELKTFNISGEYIEILDAQYPCDVYLLDKAGALSSSMLKCEASFFARPTGGYGVVQIFSSTAQTIRFFVGTGDAGTRRISSSVKVIDGNSERTKAGVAFGWRLTTVGDINNRAGIQLWNMGGSKKRVIVDSLQLSNSQAGAILWSFHNIALATVNNAKLSSLLYPGGSANTLTQSREELIGPAFVPTAVLGAAYLPANGAVTVDLKRPIVLPMGSGLLIYSDLPNTAITGFAQFYEEPE